MQSNENFFIVSVHRIRPLRELIQRRTTLLGSSRVIVECERSATVNNIEQQKQSMFLKNYYDRNSIKRFILVKFRITISKLRITCFFLKFHNNL